MYSNDFERFFSDFIDRPEYDQAETALFAVVRSAFEAGWLAAGGTPPSLHKVYQLICTLKEET